MDNYTVYMHVNKANGKKYIGITSNKPNIRWHSGYGYKGQRRFYSAIVHYGWDGFEHRILETGLSKEEAEKREEELIAEYCSNDLRYGYNMENGGVIHKLSEEQKSHLAEINRGRKHSEETKRKMSEAHMGMSTRWLKGRKQSPELIAKRTEKMRGVQNPNAKAVYQYDLDGNFITKYDYMDQAKAALGIPCTSHISQCCCGKRKKAHGYMWSYELQEMKPYSREQKGGRHGI